MRPSIQDLYSIDPTTLRGLPAHEYHAKKIEVLKAKRITIVKQMDAAPSYEVLSGLNATLKYLDRAIVANERDLCELNGGTV